MRNTSHAYSSETQGEIKGIYYTYLQDSPEQEYKDTHIDVDST